MKKKMIDKDVPIGKLVRVKDVLPSPSELAVSEETTKITISLKRSSIDFFKHQAERYHTKYQRMIRDLVDRYAMQYSNV